MRSARAHLTALVAALGLVAVACSSGAEPLPKVPASKAPATSTTEFDYSQVALKAVPGRATTSTVPFGPGRATVSGTVVGDEGAVPGASVVIERVVDGQTASTVLIAGPDGTWTLPNVLGGRYTARAFRAPDLAQTAPSAVFIGATENKQLELHVKTVGGLSVKSSLAPDPPPIDRDVQLVVLVTQRTVDAQGVVRATPLPDQQVDLVGSGSWRVESTNPVLTDSNGQAVWLLRCREAGRNPLAVNVGPESIPLTVNACVDPTAIETTTTSEVTDTTGA